MLAAAPTAIETHHAMAMDSGGRDGMDDSGGHEAMDSGGRDGMDDSGGRDAMDSGGRDTMEPSLHPVRNLQSQAIELMQEMIEHRKSRATSFALHIVLLH